jgi:predicted Zn-dependent protease
MAPTAAILRALLLALALATALVPSRAPAQQQAARPELQREEPGILMGERAFRRFEAISKLYTEQRYAEALAAAESYLRGELNPYERAMGEQMAGYVLVSLDRLGEAVPRFAEALRLDALPNDAHFALMRALAQLHAAAGQWQQSIDSMTRYLRYRPGPSPEDMILIGQAHAQLGRPREALPWVRGAVERAGADAPESWFQLQLHLLFELADHRAALEVLKAVVARWPDRLRYWEMMAGAYQTLEQDADALAALMAAYNGGLIAEEAKILNLVRLSLHVQLPYQAGRILERAIEAGEVAASGANLRLLLDAWIAAREFEQAAGVIDRLAPLSGDGELLLQKAQLLMEQNRWRESIEAARQALELGGLATPGRAWLLVGIASMELGRLGEARQALQRAQESDESTRRQAREWQLFVEERIRVAETRAAGE